MAADVDADDLDFVRIDGALVDLAVGALDACQKQELRVVTAESCTGGLLATVLTEAPGAADYFGGGFVVYTPEQKCLALNLDPEMVARCGTVSPEVAIAMAEASRRCSEADIAISVTGVAGPDKDEKDNPVGLVYLAAARKDRQTELVEQNFGAIGRSRIRYSAAAEALRLLERVARAP